MQTKGVLLDTGYLITLVDPGRLHHNAARAYFEYAIQEHILLYLPTLVMAEFGVGQPVRDLPLQNFVVAPFNADDAALASTLMKNTVRNDGDSRVGTKVDLMLLAQVERLDVATVLSEDRETILRYCDAHRVASRVKCHVVLMKDGFAAGRLLDPSTNELVLTPKKLAGD